MGVSRKRKRPLSFLYLKMKLQNKFYLGLGIFILIIALIVYFNWGSMQEFQKQQDAINSCLENTSKNYCKSINMTLDYLQSPYFNCLPNVDPHTILRDIDKKSFQFTQSELKECDNYENRTA